jgi:Rps23 Pro-64 3,4-dihydroxylase Tpa1-like proline 4-hydroxylase
MSAAVYERGDVLLCHDDQLEGRRLAYVIYLVDRDWQKEDGGTLDLYESEES